MQDDTALLLLGQCYESGFGVQRNLRIAVELYKQAAQAGNKQAKTLLMPETNGSYRHIVMALHFLLFANSRGSVFLTQ